MSRKNDEALFDELASNLEYEAAQPTPTAEPIKDPGVEEREIQQMAEMVQQMGVLITKVKSLREELMQMIKDTNMEIADFSGRVRATEDSCGELSRRMGMMSSTMEHLAVSKDELQEILKKDTFSFEPNPDSIKILLGTLGVAIKKGFDDASKDAYQCARDTLKEGVEATLKDGERRIREFSEEIRKMKKIQSENENGLWVPMKVLFYLIPVISVGFVFGVWGFTNYINYTHQKWLGVAFVIAVAAQFLWSVGTYLYRTFGKSREY